MCGKESSVGCVLHHHFSSSTWAFATTTPNWWMVPAHKCVPGDNKIAGRDKQHEEMYFLLVYMCVCVCVCVWGRWWMGKAWLPSTGNRTKMLLISNATAGRSSFHLLLLPHLRTTHTHTQQKQQCLFFLLRLWLLLCSRDRFDARSAPTHPIHRYVY